MQRLEDVFLVSDGIMVQFGNGKSCYFPASFLLDHANEGSNQMFTHDDPSLRVEYTVGVPAHGQNSDDGSRGFLH